MKKIWKGVLKVAALIWAWTATGAIMLLGIAVDTIAVKAFGEKAVSDFVAKIGSWYDDDNYFDNAYDEVDDEPEDDPDDCWKDVEIQ